MTDHLPSSNHHTFLASLWVNNSVMARCLTILGITLVLLLPLSFFTQIVDERSELYDEAIRNIAELWGTSQTVSGPALIIPYTVLVDPEMYSIEISAGGQTARSSRTEGISAVVEEPSAEPEKKKKAAKNRTQPSLQPRVQYMVVLPKTVKFSTALASETRYRGIYNYVVYTAPVSIQGTYTLPEDMPVADSRTQILWDQAFFCLSVTDLKAVTDVGSLVWNGKQAAPLSPGSSVGSYLLGRPGLYSKIAVSPKQRDYAFSMEMSMRGSGGVYFTPVGETSTIAISGNWASPNFDGQVLPAKRTITEEEFSAEWTVPYFSRSYSQNGNLVSRAGHLSEQWSSIPAFTAGVSLYDSLPLYRQITRAVKYGALFIGLTFVALLSFELVSRVQLHLVQYGLVGVAMCLFYFVLLSLAEHAPFLQSFAVASAVTVSMNGLYIATAMRSKKRGIIMAFLLVCLYGVLYALLQQQDYAIMVGTVLITVVVGVLMYLTRNLPSPNAAAKGSPAEKAEGFEQVTLSQVTE